ncbi:hypothetical protein GCM10011408_13080 [Dyella caseinilytica]|nr:hypothetical protein GCM10011408_13080 [Dyella caseinilytica]
MSGRERKACRLQCAIGSTVMYQDWRKGDKNDHVAMCIKGHLRDRLRLAPLYTSLLMIGLGTVLSHASAQTINLTTANPSYALSGDQSVTAITVANGVNGTIAGSGYTLTYSGAATKFALGGTASGANQTLNMSGLTNFIFDNPTQRFSVGGQLIGSSVTGSASGTLTLASAGNVITTSSFGVADVGRSISATNNNTGTLNLGQSNTINANTINIGANQSTGTMQFASGITNGSLVLRATDGSSAVANWNIGTGASSNYTGTSATVNLSAGTLDALVTNVLIGQSLYGTVSNSAVGTLILGNGTLDATSVIVGQNMTTESGAGRATGTLTIGNATVATQTLTLGDHPNSQGSVTGIVNLNGGALLAQTIQSGAGTATRTFNWNNGTIGNYASGENMTVSIPGITLAGGGAQIFDIEGAGANATVSSVLSGAGGFTKNGAGILTLTASNAYAGGTTVTSGLINFAALSNFGTGNITLNGGGLQWATGNRVDVSARLNPLGVNGATFDTNGNNVTLAGNLAGAGGSLIKNGAGVLVLTGTNTYGGGTRINAGTLQLGNGSTTGSIVGNVIDNSQLAVVHSDTLTLSGVISGSGSLAQSGTGTTILTGNNTYTGGTLIVSGTLQLGDGGTSGSVVGAIMDGAGIANAALTIDQSSTVTLSGSISGSGSLNQIGTGTTILTGTNTYTGGTAISAGTLQLGSGGTTGSIVGDVTNNGTLAFNRSDTVVYSNIISGTGGLTQLGPGTLQLEGAQTYTGPTNILGGILAVDGSIQSDTTTIASGATLSGFGDLYADVINQGTVWPGNAIAGDTNYGTLTIHGNYVGQGGVLALNTYLGGDGSPSDILAIDGGAATGITGVIVHNTATAAAETSGDGILVVSAINGATTATDAFNLIGETRSGALDYRLFRGSVDGTSPDSWYLRNEFTVPPEPPEPPEPPVPPEPPLPPDPPPEPLPPGVYPIIGPEVATYGVVQPVARELGMLTLGTMDQRIGDSALMASSSAGTDQGPSAWGRLFATNIDNSYRAFAAPQANGNLYGFQTGVDVWQGETFAGHVDRFGGYVSYGQADISVRGLVTNEEATNYAMQHTGDLTLRATSAGAYWTHDGPGGWYLDGVVQASTYNGAATTENTRLNTNGVGFMGSLEFGYPFSLPQLGSSFVLEPQVQAIWQHTAFSPNDDGLGEVNLGSTNGSTGRVGVRGKWQLTSANGQLWEPYAALNVWRDWGGRSTTVFGDSAGDASTAPLVPQASRAELDGGVTAKLLTRLSVYGSMGYEHELGTSANAKREGFNANVGLRYLW